MNSIEPTSSDSQLWELVCREDQTAFEILVRRYQSAVCAVAYNACGNLSLSEDISQETFWIAWRNRTSLNDFSKLRAWLCGIARNLARNSVRQRENTESLLEACAQKPDAIQEPFEQAVTHEEEALVWGALEELPELYREPLILFYRENQSVSNVAATLELSEDAVKQRLSRGRGLLRDRVLEMVEGTLRRSGPRSRFTITVMAGLTSATVGTQTALAATDAVATGVAGGLAGAKVSSIVATAGASGIMGGLLGAMGGLFGGWIGTWIPAELSPTNRERQQILSTGRRILFISLVFILVLVGLVLTFGREMSGWQRMIVIVGWILCFQTYVGIESLLLMNAIRTIRKETRVETDRNHSPTKAYIERHVSQWQGRVYRSSVSLFGWPLVDIQVSSPSLDGFQPLKTANGWVAIGDRANGILLAIGGVARGGVAIGGTSIGLLSLGGASLGILSVGGLAMGAIAVGGLAIGGIALGGGAIGWQAGGGGALAWDVAAGGGAIAHHAAFGGGAIAGDFAVGGSAFAAHANDELAKSVLEAHWMVRAMKYSKGNAGWIQAAILFISIVPGLGMPLLMYRKRPATKTDQPTNKDERPM